MKNASRIINFTNLLLSIVTLVIIGVTYNQITSYVSVQNKSKTFQYEKLSFHNDSLFRLKLILFIYDLVLGIYSLVLLSKCSAIELNQIPSQSDDKTSSVLLEIFFSILIKGVCLFSSIWFTFKAFNEIQSLNKDELNQGIMLYRISFYSDITQSVLLVLSYSIRLID